jgi:hypothetical protein
LPLFADGLRKIRRNLTLVESGQRPKTVKIGFFTAKQLSQINEAGILRGFPGLRPEILFHGTHLYKSRFLRDAYSIEEILEQIQSALSEASEVVPSASSTVIRNPNERRDRHGNSINDEAVFECTGRYPYAELYSVIPRGDGKRRPRNAKGSLEE